MVKNPGKEDGNLVYRKGFRANDKEIERIRDAVYALVEVHVEREQRGAKNSKRRCNRLRCERTFLAFPTASAMCA